MKSRILRDAFTLVELLVVMSLMAVLAAFAIAFFPGAASSAREARGGQTLQSYLMIAKQRAMRDQSPRGVRLWLRNPDGGVYAPPTWAAGTGYGVLDGVMGGTVSYRCRVNHTASAANAPPNAAFWVPTQLVTECQYIEQPDDFAGAPGNMIIAPVAAWSPITPYPSLLTNVLHNGRFFYNRLPSPPNQAPGTITVPPNIWVADQMIVSFSVPIDVTNGYGVVNPFGLNPPSNINDTNVKYWRVQPGDYLETHGTGLNRRITTIFPNFVGSLPPGYQPTSTPSKMAVTPPPPFGIPVATANYRILRLPRAVGDETLKMTTDTLIDLDTNWAFGNSLPSSNLFQQVTEGTGFYDILFAPNGSVISRGVTSTNIHLWVRAPAQDDPAKVMRGDPTIVSVFVRTGMIGAYAIDKNTTGVSAATNSIGATITTGVPHGLTAGQGVMFTGVGNLGAATVLSVPSATTFTIDNPTVPGPYAGGGFFIAPYRLVK